LDALGEAVVPEHVGRLHVFMIDRIVVLKQDKRNSVMKVLPLALHREMRLRQQLHCLATASAPFLAATDAALRRVVECAAQTKHTPKLPPKLPLLLESGLEVVLVGLAHGEWFHRSLVCLSSADVALEGASGKRL
jgi:hypothetical protein